MARNRECPCQSGRRYKHCCGALDDTDLLDALARADDEGIALGEEPSARSLLNVGRALRELGYGTITLAGRNVPPIVKRAQELNRQLFVPKEIQTGGIHLGAFLFRDMFCRLYAPVMFGSPRVDFWAMLDLSDLQKRWISGSPETLDRFTDQSADILDFGYGTLEFGHGKQLDPRGADLIWRAHAQLEAAAATATSAYDYRGTVQSALLGTELALKAGLASLGISDPDLKNMGHNLEMLAARLGASVADFDTARVLRVVRTFPHFVQSRYNLPAPGRVETGHILMGAQFVASEVTRRFSDRDVRKTDPSLPARAYPA